MIAGVFAHLRSPGDTYLVCSNGQPCMVLPMWDRAFLGRSLWLLGWHCAGWGLLCQVVWASLSCCSIQSSSAGTSSSCRRLSLLLHLNNPVWLVAGLHYSLNGTSYTWYWLFPPRPGLLPRYHRWVWRGFLLLEFSLWSYRPTRHWAILPAKHPLCHLIWPW